MQRAAAGTCEPLWERISHDALLKKHIRKHVHPSEHMFKKMNFLTSTSIRILSFLLSDPLRQFHGREIARQLGVSAGAANQYLRRFRELGLLEMDKRGRTILYRANLRNPASRQFKVLFNILALDDLLNDIKPFSDRIVLFGSCAEGTDTKDSDIDLFILSAEPPVLQRRIGGYSQKIDRKITPIVVDSIEMAKMRIRDKPLYERISRGITLWERE